MEIKMRKWQGFILMLLIRTVAPLSIAVWLMLIDGNFNDGICAGLLIASAYDGAIRVWREII